MVEPLKFPLFSGLVSRELVGWVRGGLQRHCALPRHRRGPHHRPLPPHRLCHRDVTHVIVFFLFCLNSGKACQLGYTSDVGIFTCGSIYMNDDVFFSTNNIRPLVQIVNKSVKLCLIKPGQIKFDPILKEKKILRIFMNRFA